MRMKLWKMRKKNIIELLNYIMRKTEWKMKKWCIEIKNDEIKKSSIIFQV